MFSTFLALEALELSRYGGMITGGLLGLICLVGGIQGTLKAKKQKKTGKMVGFILLILLGGYLSVACIMTVIKTATA